ncbi:MAG TPA: hypothetical protein VGR69_07805 [Candidatus Rubrimentiphilum sp.]|nr:hypothetical protein [Candidatus Rubrimentiphilum sp.]
MSRRSIVAAIVAAFVTVIAGHFRTTPYNNYVLLADALLHGHTWIAWPGAYIDALGYRGQHYVIEGPVPAFLLLPYVAVAGTAANQTLLAVLLAGVGAGAAWELGKRLGLSADTNFWLTAFLFAGTDLLWCAMLGDVWFIAHVSAVAFTLLALVELCGKRRGWLVAIWALAAAGSRFSLILAVPVYAVLLIATNPQAASLQIDRARMRSALAGFLGVLMVGGIGYIAYNLSRWGTVADIGYVTWFHQDQAGSPTGSPFALQYLGYQLWSFFVQRPDVSSVFPWIRPSYSGVALTWTSPALIFALWARRPRPLVILLWIATILVAAPSFLYYVNGFAQYGMRHALDFVPFLFSLMALAARDRLPLWTKVLILYSIVASIYGVWYWNAFLRPGN